MLPMSDICQGIEECQSLIISPYFGTWSLRNWFVFLSVNTLHIPTRLSQSFRCNPYMFVLSTREIQLVRMQRTLVLSSGKLKVWNFLQEDVSLTSSIFTVLPKAGEDISLQANFPSVNGCWSEIFKMDCCTLQYRMHFGVAYVCFVLFCIAFKYPFSIIYSM